MPASQSGAPQERAAAPQTGWLITPQPRLGTAGLTALLILANVLIPFSLDIYTPSVPEMPAYFHTTEAMVNLTLMGFFLFYAIGLLVFGPLSDKYGRKPVLVGGIVAYIGGSVLCAVAPSIYVLIGARVIQAIGAGAVNAVTTALVKDCFVPEKRGALLALIQVLAVVGPVAAPLLGGFIITFAPWRAIFWVLAFLGFLCLIAGVLFIESLPPEQRVTTGALRSLAGLGRIARQRKFMFILLASSMFNVAFMAFIAVGSYIYVDFFGETPQAYTYFYALTAALTVLGPALYIRFEKNISPYRFTYLLIAVGGAGGAALLVVGGTSVWVFTALIILLSLLEATVRPYTTNLMLGLARNDTGSASSMINFMYSGLGTVGMGLIMLPFPNFVVGLGIVLVASMAAALPLWYGACNTSAPGNG